MCNEVSIKPEMEMKFLLLYKIYMNENFILVNMEKRDRFVGLTTTYTTKNNKIHRCLPPQKKKKRIDRHASLPIWLKNRKLKFRIII